MLLLVLFSEIKMEYSGNNNPNRQYLSPEYLHDVPFIQGQQTAVERGA